ncbi:MAG TPA: CoA transferase [Caulobacteraceae bacterium]|nr:CoA transferase [Caulobacteraceae bacterium]
MSPEDRSSRFGAPLADLIVAEIGGDVATRYCGRLFSILGAQVLRLQPGQERAPRLFAAWLDEGKTPAEAIAHADLVIAGLEAEDIGKAETAIARLGGDQPVLLALSWFGAAGPYASWRANDPVIQAMTGLAFGFGQPEGPPVIAQGFGPQMVAGVVGFIAALAALMSRRTRPARVEVNVFGAALSFVEPGAAAAPIAGFQSQRLGPNRFSPTYPCNIYPTADGWLGVTALTPAQWRSLAELVGRPELGADPRFATALERLALADDIDAVLAPAIRERPTDFWVAEGERRRIPLTPAPRPAELPAHAHWRARRSFAPLTGAAKILAPTLPFRFSWGGERAARPLGGPKGPLDGIRVADFSMGWAGPLATRYLADLGGDVLKIESSAKPDWWRGWEIVPEQEPPAHELPLTFMAVNRGKRGLDLDLAAASGKAAARAIIGRADVVIDNQGPGVMERLGLGAAEQRALNPAVIAIAMPPFGATGPLAGLRAYGSTVEQASGLPFVNGAEGWAPAIQHVAYGDPVAGLYAAAAALIGLWGRERLGGSEIDLCQVERLFQLGAWAIIAEQADGRIGRDGSRRAEMAPCCVVRSGAAEEAWTLVTAQDDGAWRALATVIGRPDLASDAGLSTLAGRKAREGEIETAIAGWAGPRQARDAVRELQAAGLAAAEVTPAHLLWRDPHLTADNFWVRQQRRYVGEHLTPKAPFRYDGARPAITRPAPVLGEHTEEVLAELGIERA